MRIRHSDLRIGHAAMLVPHHEGDYAREVASKGQHLQVLHEVHVILPAGRNARGMINERQLPLALRFRNLNPPLHTSNGVEILDQLGPIALWESALKMLELLADGIEHAALLAQPRKSGLWIGAGTVPKQALEDNPRIVLCRQRRILALPADCVRI